MRSNKETQAKDILDGVGAAKDAKGDWSDADWKQPQRKQEGQGWANMDNVTASHTYTGSKRGTKRG